ncbi:MAG TPA: alginate lyase family protein, partial [Pyrinomonadaceae bacterium]|nr:alginate lyase family protein [Pyrinomonadaceae bacterium]
MNAKKLREISVNELRVRTSQLVSAFAERKGWSGLTKLPTDETLLELLYPQAAGIRAEDFLKRFVTRIEPRFFAAFIDRDATIQEMRSRWPAAESAIVRRANDIVDGKFDLLGFRDLSFGNPIDWHLEPLSGKRAPSIHWSRLNFLDAELAGDKKIVWELNRHQYFASLGQAYWLTGDEKYAQTFVTHLDSWMNQNPPKLGINWASSLEVAFRSISWIWALYFFKESPALNTQTFLRALKFLYLNARHLETYLSTYFSPNTHLTGEALGLFYLGTMLPDFKEADRWRRTGLRILIEQLPLHVKPDGVYFEQSSYYHRYTTDFYTHLFILLRANGQDVPVELETKLRALLDHLMYITRPDGTTPLFGDDDGGKLVMLDRRALNDFRGALSTGAALFGRSDYKYVADGAAEETLWLLGPDGLRELDLIEPGEPARQSVAFEDGGYYVMRDGWTATANYLRFDFGPHGTLNCGHAHADALSFDLAARGRTMLVDPGTYTYTGSKEMRDWFRSSAAHNTLIVDDQSSSVSDGPFSWKHIAQVVPLQWISHAQFDFLSGKHNGYERLASPATHVRDILFLKTNYWIIRDRVATKGAHRYDLYFHFAADAHPSIHAAGKAMHERPGNLPGLEVFAFGDGGQWREEEGWISPCYGKHSAAPVSTFTVEAEGAQEFVTFMIPRAARQDQPSVRVLDRVEGKVFEVRDTNTRDVLILGQGQLIETGELASDFQLAWVRFDVESSLLEELVLIGGRRLVVDGQEIVNASQF